MKLMCPLCKMAWSYISIVSHFENDYDWNSKTDEYEPFAQCPDQGDVYIKCEHCNEKIQVVGCDPNDLEQDDLTT